MWTKESTIMFRETGLVVILQKVRGYPRIRPENALGQDLVFCYLWGGVVISQDNWVRVDSGIGYGMGYVGRPGSGVSSWSQPDV